jgi:CelD/BcsL family acetyltransferase involved in cellulose biosynthesis
MSQISIKILTSREELLKNAVQWNSLWERSDVTLPTVRAECIELWLRHFVPDSMFHTVVVESDGQFVAALPIYRSNKIRFLHTGMLTSNDWSYCGDLLLDCSCDTDAVLESLFVAIKTLPYDILWFDSIRFEKPRWKLFREYLEKTGRKSQWLMRYQSAVASLDGEKETLLQSWNKKEMSNIKRRLKKWYLPDSYSFQVLDCPDEIQSVLPQCYALENAGWKGLDGGSILKSGRSSFFTEQAKILVAKNLFRLYLLYFEEELIAFRYTFCSKGTLFSQKTSYAPEHKEKSPGQILLWFIINTLLDDSNIKQFDFVGISSPNQMFLNPELQTMGQVVLPLSFSGKIFFSLYDTIMPWIRRRREKKMGSVHGQD